MSITNSVNSFYNQIDLTNSSSAIVKSPPVAKKRVRPDASPNVIHNEEVIMRASATLKSPPVAKKRVRPGMSFVSATVMPQVLVASVKVAKKRIHQPSKEERICAVALRFIDDFFKNEDTCARSSRSKNIKTFQEGGREYWVRKEVLVNTLQLDGKKRKSQMESECTSDEKETILRIFNTIAKEKESLAPSLLSDRARLGLKTLGDRYPWTANSTPGRVIEDAIFNAILAESDRATKPGVTALPPLASIEERICRRIDDFFVNEDTRARSSWCKNIKTFQEGGKEYQIRKERLGEILQLDSKKRKSRMESECTSDEKETILRIFNTIAKEKESLTPSLLSSRARLGLKTLGDRYPWTANSTPGRVIEDAIFNVILAEPGRVTKPGVAGGDVTEKVNKVQKVKKIQKSSSTLPPLERDALASSLTSREERICAAASRSIDIFFTTEDQAAKFSKNTNIKTFQADGETYRIRQKVLRTMLLEPSKERKHLIESKFTTDEKEMISKIFRAIVNEIFSPQPFLLSNRARVGLRFLGCRSWATMDSTPGRVIEEAIFRAILADSPSSAS